MRLALTLLLVLPFTLAACGAEPTESGAAPSGETGSSYDDWESITSDSITYAGRDTDAYPIRGSDEGNEVLAADGNEFGPNHKTVTNILYAGGEVLPFDIVLDGEEILAEYPEYEQDGLPVGPDSPHEDLQKLRID